MYRLMLWLKVLPKIIDFPEFFYGVQKNNIPYKLILWGAPPPVIGYCPPPPIPPSYRVRPQLWGGCRLGVD